MGEIFKPYSQKSYAFEDELGDNKIYDGPQKTIASLLGMDTRTVKKLLAMSEQEYLDFQQHLSSRSKKLAPYEDYIKYRLEQCLDASSAQVHDWLKEHHPSFPNVSIKSVYNFVLYVRNKHQLLKIFDTREYSQVEQLPYGQQAQVDFGEYNMTDVDGQRKKVYFFAMVLARPRFKKVVPYQLKVL